MRLDDLVVLWSHGSQFGLAEDEREIEDMREFEDVLLVDLYLVLDDLQSDRLPLKVNVLHQLQHFGLYFVAHLRVIIILMEHRLRQQDHAQSVLLHLILDRLKRIERQKGPVR